MLRYLVFLLTTIKVYVWQRNGVNHRFLVTDTALDKKNKIRYPFKIQKTADKAVLS